MSRILCHVNCDTNFLLQKGGECGFRHAMFLPTPSTLSVANHKKGILYFAVGNPFSTVFATYLNPTSSDMRHCN